MKTNKFKFLLTVEVVVEAFDEADAKDIINDNFGPGEDCGVEIKTLAIKETK